MQNLPLLRWNMTYGADLACRFWGEECLVHHALSNDTHRLAAWAGRLLMALLGMGVASTEALSEYLDQDAAEVEAALVVLAELDLVSRCR
jgi:hypothetical protein